MRWPALVVALAACGDNVSPLAALRPLTAGSPYDVNCFATQPGLVYAGLEVEPSLAIDPIGSGMVVAAWQQDRWSNGGATGIGTAASLDDGATWTLSRPPLTHCDGGAYDRASDPWVSIGPDLTPWLVALAFDAATSRSAVLATSLTGDGTWSAPQALIADDDPDVFNDKEMIASDDQYRYVVWDRLTGVSHPTEPIGTGPTMLARGTLDGVWEPARAIFDPGIDAQTLGNVIAPLPDGSLVCVFDVVTQASSATPPVAISAMRSTDRGQTWSAPVAITPELPTFQAVVAGHPVRDGAGLPEVGVDTTTGTIYVTWETAFDSGIPAVAVSRSVDSGATWSDPIRVNGAPAATAFTPMVAVASNGTVAITYYDTRESGVTAWIARSHDGGQTWADERIGGPVDLGPALIGIKYYFLGDYQGLVARGADFMPVLVLPVSADDPTDVFVGP